MTCLLTCFYGGLFLTVHREVCAPSGTLAMIAVIGVCEIFPQSYTGHIETVLTKCRYSHIYLVKIHLWCRVMCPYTYTGIGGYVGVSGASYCHSLT